MDLKSITRRVATLVAMPPPRRRKPTTAEARQELDRILDKIGPNPRPPTAAELRERAPAHAELDAVLARLDAADAEAASKGSHPMATDNSAGS